MYLLNLLDYSVDDFFDEMIRGRHDNAKNEYLPTRLKSVKEKIIKDEKRYMELAEEGVLHKYTKQE